MPVRSRCLPRSLLLVAVLIVASVGVPLRLGQSDGATVRSPAPVPVGTGSHGHAPADGDRSHGELSNSDRSNADRPDPAPPHEHHGDPFCARCLAWVATSEVTRADGPGRAEARTEPSAGVERPWERRVQVRRHGPRGPPLVSAPAPTQDPT